MDEPFRLKNVDYIHINGYGIKKIEQVNDDGSRTKIWGNVDTYFDSFFESGINGTYNVSMKNGYYKCIVSGAGGGASWSAWGSSNRYAQCASGGSGSGITAIIFLPYRGNVSITVGKAGLGYGDVNFGWGRDAQFQAENGGNSGIVWNGGSITAYGGSGGWTWNKKNNWEPPLGYRAGAGGATPSYTGTNVSNVTLFNGIGGSVRSTGKYWNGLSYSGWGGFYNTPSPFSGANIGLATPSIIPTTWYGCGGANIHSNIASYIGGNWTELYPAWNGYVRMEWISYR